ncbi:MAG: EAL domain-containing protein [Rhodoferax sp.]|nr:MAG: EAL domain-containing protein [Rhodoferax sp.]
MRNRTHLIAAVLVVLAVTLPLATAFKLAQQQAEDDEIAYLASVADEVLARGIAARKQMVVAVETLKNDPAPACSPEKQQRMRQLTLVSPYLVIVGAERAGRLLCTAFEDYGDGLSLGPSRGVTATGFEAWYGVRMPFAPDKPLNVFGRNGYVASVHPDVVIDVFVRDADVKFGLLTSVPRMVTRSHGTLRPDWLASMQANVPAVIDGGDHYVVVRSNAEHNLTGLAASPKANVAERVTGQTRRLLPIGALAGLLLSVAIVLLARQRTSIQAEIRTGLKKREFFMHYQPLVDLRTGRIVGAESLLRWRRADGSMVAPDIFIPAAEQSGLIQEVTRYVMQRVALDTAELLRQYPDFHISLNFSALDVTPGGPVQELVPLLQSLRIPTRCIVLEVTERGFINAAVARPLLHAVRAQGIQVAIDDFGTGYSSLSTLESFELDYLKIDKSFIDTIGTLAATSQVVPHIITMSQTLQLHMIAEGVETQAQVDYLRAAGVQFAQGWLFGKPMPIEDLLARVQAQEPAAALSDQ